MKSNTRRGSKSAKSERRTKRSAKSRSRPDPDPRFMTLGGDVDPDVLRHTLDAFRSFDPTGPWLEMAPRVLPLLKRVHHPFPSDLAPLHLYVPPGVWAGFGIDVGPAWAHVSRRLVDDWAIDETTLLGTALENLRMRVVQEPPQVASADFAGVPATVVQAQGWGSALLLAPDRLATIIGPAPRTLLAPVRDSLVALPVELDVDIAVAIWSAFADGARDELDVEPLHWTGSSVEPIDDRTAGLIH